MLPYPAHSLEFLRSSFPESHWLQQCDSLDEFDELNLGRTISQLSSTAIEVTITPKLEEFMKTGGYCDTAPGHDLNGIGEHFQEPYEIYNSQGCVDMNLELDLEMETEARQVRAHRKRPAPLHPLNALPSAVLSSRTVSSVRIPAKDDPYDIVRQPETRLISHEQLVAEVKGIYAGLVLVEAKCIEVDNKQATLAQTKGAQSNKLNNEQWQALIALHRTLLHEHHDFFLASQHPSASPALRRLASKYAMPARMWRHGIHSFLELLRHRLPDSLDHMLAFIYLAYSMMALLFETVPAFEDTWIECLGDLGRYRMAIEDDDIRDREVWTGVARHWYSKASDKAPTIGRLYHHLAILARPSASQQLFHYAKSLCVATPFASARESIMTLFEPMAHSGGSRYRVPPLDTAFVKAHGLLFTGKKSYNFDPAISEFLGLLDHQIGRVTRKFMEQGYHIAISNMVAMLGFGSKENALMKALSSSAEDELCHACYMSDDLSHRSDNAMQSFEHALQLSNTTLQIFLSRIGDPNFLPFIHATLHFMTQMSRPSHPISDAIISWDSYSFMIGELLNKAPNQLKLDNFPLPEVKDDNRPLPEDFALRGLLWADDYYPDTWFSNDKIDDEEMCLGVASMSIARKERILWLATRLGSWGSSWLVYDPEKRGFGNMNTMETTTPIAISREGPSNIDSNFLSRFRRSVADTMFLTGFRKTMSSWMAPRLRLSLGT
jgi:hypothetical protein